MRTYQEPKEIIAKLVLQSKPLRQFILCLQLKELFPRNKLISKIYLKNQILRVEATSNITYTELKHEHTINSLKTIIKQFKKYKGLGDEWDVKDVKIFYKPSKLAKRQEKQKLSKKAYFFEPAVGDFANTLSDELLHAQFEKIRQAIKIAKE